MAVEFVAGDYLGAVIDLNGPFVSSICFPRANGESPFFDFSEKCGILSGMEKNTIIAVLGLILSVAVIAGGAVWTIHVALDNMRSEMSDMRSEMRSEISDVRSEISEVRAEVAELRGAVTELSRSMTALSRSLNAHITGLQHSVSDAGDAGEQQTPSN